MTILKLKIVSLLDHPDFNATNLVVVTFIGVGLPVKLTASLW